MPLTAHIGDRYVEIFIARNELEELPILGEPREVFDRVLAERPGAEKYVRWESRSSHRVTDGFMVACELIYLPLPDSLPPYHYQPKNPRGPRQPRVAAPES